MEITVVKTNLIKELKNFNPTYDIGFKSQWNMSKTNGNKNLIKYDIDQRPMEKTYKFRFSYLEKTKLKFGGFHWLHTLERSSNI